MWLSEMLPTIAGFLNFKSIARLYSCSKECKENLATVFISQAHPNALKIIAKQLIAERSRVPSMPTMTVREEGLLRFSDFDAEGNGPTTLFRVAVKEDGTIEISTAYGANNGPFTTVLGHAQAVLTLDPLEPMRRGRVVVNGTNTVEYTDGIVLRDALGWCPLLMPSDS